MFKYWLSALGLMALAAVAAAQTEPFVTFVLNSTAVTSLTSTDSLYVVQGSSSRKVTPGIVATPGATVVVTTGSVTVGASDGTIICNKVPAADTPITLPAASTRSGLPLRYTDFSGGCGKATFTPAMGETIGGVATWTVISGGVAGSGGSVALIPNTTLPGWLVQE